MTAKEMHIQFGLGYQKLGANSRRKFYEPEIDAFLNRAMDQFVQDAVRVDTDNKGFERIQVDVDKVRNLIVRGYYGYPAWNGDSVRYSTYSLPLPGDYAYLVSDAWAVSKKCETSSSTSKNRAVFTLPFPKITTAQPPYYTTVQLYADGTLQTDLTLHIPDSKYTGFPALTDRFEVIRLLLEVFYERRAQGMTSQDQELYWERYGDLYYPNSFVFVSHTGMIATASLKVDTVTSAGGLNQRPYTLKTTTNPTQLVAGRLVKASVVDNLLTMPFYGPAPTSPISVLAKGTLTLYSHPSYIVNAANLTYVRKPARINLSLQRNCELAPDFHQKIVDMAVEFAAGRTEQQGLYQVTAGENQKTS